MIEITVVIKFLLAFSDCKGSFLNTRNTSNTRLIRQIVYDKTVQQVFPESVPPYTLIFFFCYNFSKGKDNILSWPTILKKSRKTEARAGFMKKQAPMTAHMSELFFLSSAGRLGLRFVWRLWTGSLKQSF